MLSQAAQPAPLSYAECYLQVDLWSNEHIRSDPHYTQADGASEFMSHHQARARQIEENIKIIDVKWRLSQFRNLLSVSLTPKVSLFQTADIGEVFMKNMLVRGTYVRHRSLSHPAPRCGRWEHRATASKPGVVPLKMSTVEGIELLAKAGIVPEAIYVDASHHYKDVIQELTLCLKHFPDAAVCGDDWDCEPRPPARPGARHSPSALSPQPWLADRPARGSSCQRGGRPLPSAHPRGRWQVLDVRAHPPRRPAPCPRRLLRAFAWGYRTTRMH